MTLAPCGDLDLVPAMLREYGELTRVHLCRYLAPREPRRHLYNLVADYPRRGGRMLRPSLCIATARAFGASVEDAVGSAAALELLHNGFLVHDDIEDESDSRRGKPTLHALHGVPTAVNVGDALTVLGLRALIDNHERLGPALTLRILAEAERMARDCVEGQAIELGWRRDNILELSDADYLEMVLKKTCSYTTIFPLRVGALIGTRGAIDPDRLLRFGFFLGAAFQIQDDILNLEGDAHAYGKELSGDLWEGKRTLMLIHVLRECTHEERARLGRFLALSRPDRTTEEVTWVRAMMHRYDAITRARETAHALTGGAQHEGQLAFRSLRPSRDSAFLEAAASWVLARS
jgi:geranylgeranyl diphosphate synthase, type II